jgi:hypothetical protein
VIESRLIYMGCWAEGKAIYQPVTGIKLSTWLLNHQVKV